MTQRYPLKLSPLGLSNFQQKKLGGLIKRAWGITQPGVDRSCWFLRELVVVISAVLWWYFQGPRRTFKVLVLIEDEKTGCTAKDLIGRRLTKKFKGVVYNGTVKSYQYKPKNVYPIVYCVFFDEDQSFVEINSKHILPLRLLSLSNRPRRFIFLTKWSKDQKSVLSLLPVMPSVYRR